MSEPRARPADGETVLRASAFGPSAGLHPLPAATTARGRWHRAVALGGQGRMAAATAQMRAIRTSDAALASSVLSTRASHLRQFGAHDRARTLDAAALVHVGTAVPETSAPEYAAARCDALTGLAADALWPGRVALAERLQGAAHRCLATAPARCLVRWHWVSAETALCTGSVREALDHARAACRVAREQPSVRHQVKSELLVSVVLGDVDLVGSAGNRARGLGLLPLAWAATQALGALRDDRRTDDDDVTRCLRARGAWDRL